MTEHPKPERLEDPALLELVRHQPCIIPDCGAVPCDPSHIRSRGAGGPDTSWNVVPMCRPHHTEWHAVGITKFISKYPRFFGRLLILGWHLEEQEGRWRLWHPKMLNWGMKPFSG